MNLPLSRLLGAAYYIEKFGEVEGWLDPTTALAMMELLWEQERNGLSGNIAEIGIHHGLSFLALTAGAAPDDTLYAIDLFDDQGRNVDGSGQGNERVFRRNLDRFFPNARVEIVRGSSLLLRGKEAEHGLAMLRFLSIDGGHTREITLNDLRIAEKALAPHGIACVDDIYSSHWPGVISAVCDFLRGEHQLVPFCFLPNKLFLCRPSFAERYTAFLRYAFFAALEEGRDPAVRLFRRRVRIARDPVLAGDGACARGGW